MYHDYMNHLLTNISVAHNGGRLANHPREHDNMLFYPQLIPLF